MSDYPSSIDVGMDQYGEIRYMSPVRLSALNPKISGNTLTIKDGKDEISYELASESRGDNILNYFTGILVEKSMKIQLTI